MDVDTSETLAQKAESAAEAILAETNGGNLVRWCPPRTANAGARLLKELAAANAQLERERDEARASVATCQAFVAARGTNRDYQQARAEKAEAERDATLTALRAREAEVGRLREALVRLCAWGRMTPSTPDERSAEQREGWGAFDQARAALATPAPEDAA